MQHPTRRGAEVTGHIATQLQVPHLSECADLLKSGHKMLIEIFTHFFIIQCLRTEGFGIVSGELFLFEIARDVKDEKEL